MSPELIPSLLVDSEAEFARRLRLVEPHVRTVHVDVLDGTLFPQTSWFDAEAVGRMNSPVRFELHLMVENPLPIVQQWHAHVPNTRRAIVHAEIHRALGAVLERLQVMHLEAAVALNPETVLHSIHHVQHMLSQVTVMGVHPGASGQSFLGDEILSRVREIRNTYPHLAIELDGGLTHALIEPCLQAGVDRFCAASLLFSAHDPLAALTHAQQTLSTSS